jgi:hypothetical protein
MAIQELKGKAMPRKNKDLLKESHDVFTSAHDQFMRKANFYLPDPSANRLREMMVSVDRDILLADTYRDINELRELENVMTQIGIKAFALVLAIHGVAAGDTND